MIKMHAEYNSPNEIYFHHSTSIFQNNLPVERKPEVHFQCEILLLLSGKIQYKIDGEIYNMLPGEVILLNICELHSIHIDPSEPYERMALQFSPNLIPKLTNLDLLKPFSAAKSFRHILPREFVEKSKIRTIFNQIKRDCMHVKQYTDLTLISRILAILKELDETTKLVLNSKAPIAYATSADKFSKLCANYVNENISKKITAKDIANHLHVCESHLHHLFRKEMNMSVHAYILNQKMQLAALMLASGKSPQEVSDSLGYDYYSTFFNNFQSFFGYTPNQHNYFQRLHNITPPSEKTDEGMTVIERIKHSIQS